MNFKFATNLADFFEFYKDDPDALFDNFASQCEVDYWNEIFKTRNYIYTAIKELPRIDIPPAVYTVIQSNGYKKWIDTPNYESQKALSKLRDKEIQKVRNDRSEVAKQAVLNYLKFIQRWESFISRNSKKFLSIDEIHDFLNKKCSTYWLEYFDLEFEEWLDDWFWDFDFSNIVELAKSTDESLCTESFFNFTDALNRAKNLAYEIGSEVAIKRDYSKWIIFYKPNFE